MVGNLATHRRGRAEKKELHRPNLLRREKEMCVWGRGVEIGKEKSEEKTVWEEVNTLDV